MSRNPFIPIILGYRILIIGYVLFYYIFTPGLSIILHGSVSPLPGWRYTAEIAYLFLLLLPILFYRSSYGWLHPLIFPAIFGIATGIVRNPQLLLEPFLVFSEQHGGEIHHVALWSWSQEAIAWAALKAKIISMVALSVYYFGFFFGPQPSIPYLVFTKPRNIIPKVLTVVALSAVVFLIYIHFKGGLTAHISSWGQGRFIALAGEGPVMVLIECGMVASLIWFALDRTASRNPLFWIVLLFVVPVNFFTGGSRSSVISAVVLFLMIFMIRHQKIPKVKIIAIAVAAFILVGALGTLRRSTYQGEVDWTVLTDFSLKGSIEVTREELEWRGANSGYLPVIAKVPDKVGLLYGKSYVGTLLFFIPRALWPDKPHGAGTMNGEIIFEGGSGVPTGPVGEAYWNFYIPGVVIMFFLYGLFHRWLARTFAQYSRVPTAWVLYVLTLSTFSPESTRMVGWFHLMIPAIVILYWIGALSFNKRKKRRYVPTGAGMKMTSMNPIWGKGSSP